MTIDHSTSHGTADSGDTPAPAVVIVIGASTLLAALVVACFLFGLLNPLYSGIAEVNAADNIARLVGVLLASLPLAGLLVGAIMFLRMRSQGRIVLIVYYWIIIGAALVTLLGCVTNPRAAFNASMRIIVSALAATAAFAATILICLHKPSVRIILSRQNTPRRLWLTIACIAPAFLVGAPLILVAGYLSFQNLYTMLLRPDFDRVGGLRLVYQIDRQDRPTDDQIANMVRAIELRIDPWGTAGVRVSALGSEQIEVLVPLLTDYERIQSVKDRISRMGRLEFQILANEKHDGELGKPGDCTGA